LATGVAHEGGGVANEEDDFVAEVLELAELSEEDGVSEVEIRSRRIKPGLDEQGLLTGEFCAEFSIGNELSDASLQDLELGFRIREGGVPSLCARSHEES